MLPPLWSNIFQVAALFLKLGATAFGGPAAHVALLHDEVVRRRKWLDEQHFLDLLGATNLIPGPNSTEMAIHIGYMRAGWAGLIVGGTCFILPAMLIVMALAAVYQQFGSAPQITWLMVGIKPVVIAVIALALLDLRKRALKHWGEYLLGLAVLVAYLLDINQIALLLISGVAVMLIKNRQRLPPAKPLIAIALIAIPSPIASTLPAAIPLSLERLFFTFLKIGAVLYGSGYVLLAFLRADFVIHLGWLSDQQLLDAIAIGQVTPGPLFTTATFIGYLLGGIAGAILATVGIFLPAFVFVALSNPLIPRIRHSPWAGAFLDGVNIASLGLMAGVTLQLGRASLINPLTIATSLVAFLLLWRYKINATWLILGGGVIGLIQWWIG